MKVMSFSCGNPTPEIIELEIPANERTEEIKQALLSGIFPGKDAKHILAEDIETKGGKFIVYFDTNTLITGGVEIEVALNRCIYVTSKDLHFGTTGRIVFAKLQDGTHTDVNAEDIRFFTECSKPLVPSAGTYQINLIEKRNPKENPKG